MMKQELIFELTYVCNYYLKPNSKNNFKVSRKFEVYPDKEENKLFTYTFNGYPVTKYMYNYLYMIQIGRENNLDNHEKREIEKFFHRKWVSILNDDLAADLPTHEKEIQEIKKNSAEEYVRNNEKFKSVMKNISEKTLIPEEDLTFPGVYGKTYYGDSSILKILNNIVKNYTNFTIEKFDKVCSFIKNNMMYARALSLRNTIVEQNKVIELPKKNELSEPRVQDRSSVSPSNLLMLCAVSEMFQPISESEDSNDEHCLKRFRK